MTGSPAPTRTRAAAGQIPAMRHPAMRHAAWAATLPLALGLAPLAAAEPLTDSFKRRLYFYAGSDMARDTSYGWAGVAWAPFARMDEEGLRLRFQGGGGRYRYETADVAGGWNGVSKTEAEGLIGWQTLRGPHALALYAGVAMIDNQLDMPDPANQDQGTRYGAKLVAEWFYRWDERRTLSAAISATTADSAATARFAAGWRMLDWLELGVETAATSDWPDRDVRLGGFLVVPVKGQELRAAGGWRWSSDETDGAYLTLSVYMPY
ncbi:cellulose biosynthesis protein BcsS [Ancylobacter sp. SL191]|uniref:cellulose biosynthesis protein BcsS n=1 Tax=Ancylobacter sp. SL191 TaxID=2995166 RepID=UPI00226F6038|nr:cellulose biosynthesis protein BcsS [Ancylobacter sp. SL191]WAC26004.1 cellulose biosynthesis protein BcsS [Ancylobacter sp. SL191]